MNVDCYFCAGMGMLTSDEVCNCVTNTCNCHNCLYRKDEKKKRVEQHQKTKPSKNRQWEQQELPFNNHKQGPTGYDYKSIFKDNPKNKPVKQPVKQPVKPDPATVEAELQLEEKLWAS